MVGMMSFGVCVQHVRKSEKGEGKGAAGAVQASTCARQERRRAPPGLWVVTARQVHSFAS